MLFLAPVMISAAALPPMRTVGLGAARHRCRHSARLRPPAVALGAGRDAVLSAHLPGRHLVRHPARRSPSSASMPGASRKRRGSSPRRWPRQSSCWRASSICRSSTAWRQLRRTSSARRWPPSRWSPSELQRIGRTEGPIAEDITLLGEQVDRCRGILAKLTSLGDGSSGPLDTMSAPRAAGGGRRVRSGPSTWSST